MGTGGWGIATLGAACLLAWFASDVRAPVVGERPVPPIAAPRAAPLVGEGGRLYVVSQAHPAADDGGPGTADQPWRTISRAAQRMRPGDAVRIHAGVYRETVAPARGGTGEDARITYAAAPGERVVITGADRVPDGWRPDDPGVWNRAWTFGPMPTYDDRHVFRRELAVARGRVLRPVASPADLVAGTMHVSGPDTAPVGITVHLPDGMTPAEVEIATRQHLFWPMGATPYVSCGDPSMPSWLRVVGLTFRHAANRAQWGAVCAGASNGLWEDVTVEWTIGQGVDTSGRDHVFRRVASDDHGQLGWGGQSERLLLEDTRAARNNWRGHDPLWEAGGGKWLFTSESVFRRYTAVGNDGPGLWLDTDNTRNTIEGGRFHDNLLAGVMLELNTVETLVQHNVVTGTRWHLWSGAGVLSQAASRNAILHNTLRGNAGTGLWLRLDPERRAPDVGTRVEANLVTGNAVEAPEAREISVEADGAAALHTHVFASNAYGRHAGDPLWHSTFYVFDVTDYRGNDLGTWASLTGEREARLLRAGDPPPLVKRGAQWGAVGAPAAPAAPWTHAGADPSRVARQ